MLPVEVDGGQSGAGDGVDVSIVLPCYNEADCLPSTVPPLVEVFRSTERSFELILVDNGSTDGTAGVIDSLVEAGLPIRKASVAVNRGQGLGIRTGLQAARGRVVGYCSADGQVEPRAVVDVYRAVAEAPRPVVGKIRRCQRNDGLQRRIVSLVYNTLFQVLYPGVASRDINANPKFLPAEIVRQMELVSDDWFLEAEIMLKARHLGLPVVEVVVPDRPRQGGRSHVRIGAIFEFLRNLLWYRVGGPWRAWKRKMDRSAVVVVEAAKAGH